MPLDSTYLKVSDGTGDATLMTVTATRLAGSTVLAVNTLVRVPQKFIATSGTLDAGGFIDSTTARTFYGQINGSNLQIDGFVAGSTDAGNTIGQVVVIKPNTAWADMIAGFVEASSVAVGENLLNNGNFINSSINGYGGTPEDWTSVSGNPIQGGIPALTKQTVIDTLGVTDGDIEGLWNLNGSFADLSANTYTLTASGSPTDSNDGLMAQAKGFVAASSQYATGAAANAKLAASQTWSVHVKPTALNGSIMGFGDSDNSEQKYLYIGSGGIVSFALAGLATATINSDVILEVNKWYHIVARYDSVAATLSLWVNGVKKTVSTSGVPSQSTSNNFSVGRYGDYATLYFSGLIQNAMVLSVALTDSQVKKLWSATTYKGIKVRRAGGTDGYIYQELPEQVVQSLRGKTITAVAQVWQEAVSQGAIAIWDGTTETASTNTSTTGSFVQVSATATIPATASTVVIRLKASTTNGNVWFKETGLFRSGIALAYSPSPMDWARFPNLLRQTQAAAVNGYSFEENRLFSYTPTYSASGSMTFTSVTTSLGVYTIRGSTCWHHIDSTGTTGGVASTSLIYSLPVVATSSLGTLGGAIIAEAGTTGGFAFLNTITQGGASRYDNANLGLGANRRFRVNAVYSI